MQKKEVTNLLGIATGNFPRLQDKDMRPTAELWAKALNDLPYETAEKALIKVLSTSKFFPTVSEIRNAAAELTQPQRMTAMKAWSLITEAIRKYGIWRQAEGLASLPEDVRRMAEQFTWRELCLNENPDTLRAQFRMAWETQSKREDELKAVPGDIRQMLGDMADGMKMVDE